MAALLQRIDEALAGIHGFEHEHFDGGTFETNTLAELDEHGNWRTWDMNALFSTKACAFIAAAPALLRECAALLRGLDDGADIPVAPAPSALDTARVALERIAALLDDIDAVMWEETVFEARRIAADALAGLEGGGE